MVIVVTLSLILVACDVVDVDSDTQDSVDSKTENVENNNENNSNNNDSNEEESTDYDKVLVDSDTAKVTLQNITKVVDSMFDEEYYKIKVEIENKYENTLEVQTREFSIDGKMADDMVIFSETVSSGKKSDATIKIQNYDGDLPEMKEELEFILTFIDMDDWEFEEDHDVKIELK